MSLAKAWQGRHDILWISDRLHFGQTYQSMPIHQKAFPGGLINTARVAWAVRRAQIDVIHSHSRRAHWIGAQVSRLTGRPHVTTLHQPQVVHSFSKTFPCLGDHAIAIDEAIAHSLAQTWKMPQERIHLIRNGIDCDEYVPAPKAPSSRKQILLIGRLSGGRWKLLQFFLEILKKSARTLPAAQYKIVGRIPEEKRELLSQQLSALRSAVAPSTVQALGYVNELGPLLRDSDGIIASGRSAMEAMASAKPVIWMGEGGILGLCGPELWDRALYSNLGDHLDPPEFMPARLEVALRQLLDPTENTASIGQWARVQAEKAFNIGRVAPAVEAVYHQAVARR